jgi:transcriptional regulator with XRE-family HTH domain
MLELGTIAPIALGTRDCESLSSYVQRLAAANGTFPGQLAYRALGWIEQNRTREIGGWCDHPRRVYLDRNINAFGLSAAWSSLLGTITPELPLTALTTNSWDLAFPARGFLHSTLHWCPLCLAGDDVPHHRLTWMLQPVSHCPVHDVYLSNRCSGCGRTPPVLHDRSMILACSHCGTDLRRCRATSIPKAARFPDELGAVIAHYSLDTSSTSWRSATGILALCAHAKISQPAQLARVVGTSRLTTWYWWTGRAGISLPMALHVYSALGRSFSTAMIRNEVARADPVQTQFHLSQRKPARQIDWADIRERLLEILNRPMATAPTFLEASKELGIERRTIRSHFPDLCRRISKRNVRRTQNEKNQRDASLVRDLEAAMRTLAASGLKPRQFLVEQVMGKPGLFNSQFARRIFFQITGSAG